MKSPSDAPDALIVGGGLAGLAAAWTLATAGKHVVLLEARRKLGGRAASFIVVSAISPTTGAEIVVIVRLQPPLMTPARPALSSTTKSCQSPFGSLPSKAESMVEYGPAGAGLGMKSELPSARLGTLLAYHGTLRLVLLNSCKGAHIGQDIFSSTATTLVRRGIPAVKRGEDGYGA